jgi:hypothetical protein
VNGRHGCDEMAACCFFRFFRFFRIHSDLAAVLVPAGSPRLLKSGFRLFSSPHGDAAIALLPKEPA